MNAQECERRRQHADDLAWHTIDRKDLAGDRPGAAEPALPVAVAQDHAQPIAWCVVFRAEDAADPRLYTEQRQCGGGHLQRLHALWIAISGDGDFGGIPCPDSFERLLVLAIGEIGRRPMIRSRAAGCVMAQAHQPLGF
jgi:hypothetical protein